MAVELLRVEGFFGALVLALAGTAGGFGGGVDGDADEDGTDSAG